MKAALDIPEAHYRRVKAKSALVEKPVREVTIELYERRLSEKMAGQPKESRKPGYASKGYSPPSANPSFSISPTHYSFPEKDFGVGRQSLVDKWRERIPALQKELSGDLYEYWY